MPKDQNEFEFIKDWLTKEPNMELVIPYVKEKIASGELSEPQIDNLRKRVMMIEDIGHEAYLKEGHVHAALATFQGSFKLKEKVQ